MLISSFKQVPCLSCGICNSMLMWPLPHASLVFEWQLQSDPSAIVAGTTGANSATIHAGSPYAQPIVRSQRWEIQLPRLLVPLVKLSDVADAEWSSLLSGEGLHTDLTQMVHLEASLSGPSIRAGFFRSLANVKSMYVTLFTEPFAAPTNDGGDNILIASWMKAFCKQCNFLWSGKELSLIHI
mgnify:CR=1 FL=1